VDGNEAMTKLAQGSFSMIALGWQLPKLRGMDVLRKLRASGGNIPVIVVSGLDRGEIADDLESLGATQWPPRHGGWRRGLAHHRKSREREL